MEEDGGIRRWPLVVLTSSPFHGHMTPTLQLATALQAKGFSIAIAHTKLNPPDPSNHPDFIFLPLSDNLSAIDASSSFTRFIHDLNTNCQPSFRQHLTRLITEQNRGDKSIVVIYDYLMFFAGAVAIDLNLTSIIFRSCSAAYFPAFLARWQLRQQGRFLEQANFQPTIFPTDFNFLPLSDNLSAIDASSSFTRFIQDLNTNCRPSFRQHLSRLMMSEENRSMVVIYDHLMFFAGGVAMDLNLTAILFRSCSAAYFQALLVRQQLHQPGKFLEQDYMGRDETKTNSPMFGTPSDKNDMGQHGTIF